jgi:hypothetical protein
MQAPPDLGSQGEVYSPGFYRNFVIRLTVARTIGFAKGEVGKTFRDTVAGAWSPIRTLLENGVMSE